MGRWPIFIRSVPDWYGTTPVGSTSFVGRLAEMWEVHSLLHRGDVAQITGAGAATGGKESQGIPRNVSLLYHFAGRLHQLCFGGDV
jgi:hypothetical protein